MEGLLVGRFQPFHLGHLEAVKYASSKVDMLWIVIGSAQKSHEKRNPFTAGERLLMIKNTLDAANINNWYAIPVFDANSHYLWVRSIDMLVPHYDIVFTNDPLSELLFKEEGKEVMKIDLKDRSILSGTEIRRRIASDEEWKHLVPRDVSSIIEEIGVDRIKSVSN